MVLHAIASWIAPGDASQTHMGSGEPHVNCPRCAYLRFSLFLQRLSCRVHLDESATEATFMTEGSKLRIVILSSRTVEPRQLAV